MCHARKRRLGALCANLVTEGDSAKTGLGSQGVHLAVEMFAVEVI